MKKSSVWQYVDLYHSKFQICSFNLNLSRELNFSSKKEIKILNFYQLCWNSSPRSFEIDQSDTIYDTEKHKKSMHCRDTFFWIQEKKTFFCEITRFWKAENLAVYIENRFSEIFIALIFRKDWQSSSSNLHSSQFSRAFFLFFSRPSITIAFLYFA